MIQAALRLRRVLPAAGALWLVSAPALSQTLGQGADDGISPWRLVLALVIGVGLAVAVPFALKARSGGLPLFRFALPRDEKLKLVACIRLSRNADLCLVECEGARLLLAISANGAIQPLDAPSGTTAVPGDGV